MIQGQPGLREQIKDLKVSRSVHSSSNSNAKSSAKRSFRFAVMLGTHLGTPASPTIMQVFLFLNLLLLSESKVFLDWCFYSEFNVH